ncbi:hypothetical protein [Streptomyces sp. NPDC002547]
MQEFAETVATLAGGALIAVAAMLAVKLYRLQQAARAAERERKIEAVRAAAVELVTAFRCQQEDCTQHEAPRHDLEHDNVVIRSKGHLTMLHLD